MHLGFQIENALFWEGVNDGWEKVSTKLWIDLCKSASYIFDIGANTGVYSLIAKSINKENHVYALEPVHRVFEKLEQNNRLNNFNILCIEKAASNFNGTATIYDLPIEHILSVTVNKDLNTTKHSTIPTEIETIRVDSLIDFYKIPQVDLMKIDVETHEHEVLQGMGKYLELFRPTLLIEILLDDVGANVEKMVNGLGYLYFNIDEKHGIRKVEHITKSDHFNYLLCNEAKARELGLI